MSSESLYKINVFDDGNQKFQYAVNEWFIISRNNIETGKVSLLNINKKDKINTISLWKISPIR